MAHCICSGNCYCNNCGLIILPHRKRDKNNNHLRCTKKEKQIADYWKNYRQTRDFNGNKYYK